MVRIVGSVHLGDGILKVKPNKPFFGSNGLEIFFVQGDWVKIELAPTPLGCYYLVDFTTDPTDTSFNPTEKWRVPQHDCSLAQVRGLESDSGKYQSEIQQLKEALQQRSRIHQNEVGKYQSEIQQLKEALQQRSHIHQNEVGKYQSEIQQLKEALQQRSHIHQEQSGKYQTEIQQLTQENNNLKSSVYSADKLRTEGRTELLRSFNFLQSSIPQSANYTRNSTEIDSIVNSLRQKLADKEQQINTLQSQVSNSTRTIELLQQRSQLNPRELEELKAKYNQVVQDLEQVHNASQQRSRLHQQELTELKQKLQEQQLDYERKIETIKSGKLEQLENRTELLRAFNSTPKSDRTVPQTNMDQGAVMSDLRQKLADKEQQISALQSQVNRSSQVIEQLQQRSHSNPRELEELKAKYNQVVQDLEQVHNASQQRSRLHQQELTELKQKLQEQQLDYERKIETIKSGKLEQLENRSDLLRAFNSASIGE